MNAYLALAAFAVPLALGAWSDVRTRLIPNWLCLLIAAMGLGFVAATAGWAAVPSHLAHMGIALVVGIALFAFKMWGGGDGKFYAATAAWFPLSQAFGLVFAISLAGIALLIVIIFARRGRLVKGERKSVPYGVAIAGGALANLAAMNLWLA